MENNVNPLLINLFPVKISKGDLKRFEILRAAIQSLHLNGIEGTTYQSIAEIINVRKSHVNYYFKSIDEIVGKALVYKISELSEMVSSAISEKTPNTQLLRAYIEAHFNWLNLQPENKSIMLLTYYTAIRSEASKNIMNNVEKSGENRVCQIVKIITKKKNSKRIIIQAKAITALIIGNLIYAATTENTLDESKKKYWVELTLKQAFLILQP